MKNIIINILLTIAVILFIIGCISLLVKGCSNDLKENIQHDKEIENLIGKKVKIVNDTFLIISKGKHIDKLKLSNDMEIDFKVAKENAIKDN